MKFKFLNDFTEIERLENIRDDFTILAHLKDPSDELIIKGVEVDSRAILLLKNISDELKIKIFDVLAKNMKCCINGVELGGNRCRICGGLFGLCKED